MRSAATKCSDSGQCCSSELRKARPQPYLILIQSSTIGLAINVSRSLRPMISGARSFMRCGTRSKSPTGT